jgi:uncharacterized protein YkwD
MKQVLHFVFSFVIPRKFFLPHFSTVNTELSFKLGSFPTGGPMKYIFSALLFLFACTDPSTTNPLGGLSTIDTAATTDGTSTTPAPVGDSIMTEFETLINNHRIDIGEGTLTFTSALNSIAQAHSEAMAMGTTAFGHSGFSSRCSAAYTALGGGNLCAENVAMGQGNAQAAYDAWMNSSGHKANIEQTRVNYSGFGYAKSSSGTYYWTEIFVEKN